jgi:hypothetical protein
MTWEQIRQQYPHRWLVVEAFDAYNEKGKRIIPRLEVIEAFAEDWQPAWECYKQRHHEDKWREYYMLHTDRKELNIGVMDAFFRKVTE